MLRYNMMNKDAKREIRQIGSNDFEIVIFNERVDYNTAVTEMKTKAANLADDSSNLAGALWFLEHESLYTGGAAFKESDVLCDKIPLIHSDRGGKVTYHGPGQRIVYMMINLKRIYNVPDIRNFVHRIELWGQGAICAAGVRGVLRHDQPGVWVADDKSFDEESRQDVVQNIVQKKIASIGLKVRRWVTYHGIAINVCPDMSHFRGIVPCGMKSTKMTSVAQELHMQREDVSINMLDTMLISSLKCLLLQND